MKKTFYFLLYSIITNSSLLTCESNPELLLFCPRNVGTITIFTGSMSSGKTGATNEAAQRWLRAKHKVGIFKPNIDNRKLTLNDDQDPTQHLSSRNGTSVRCVPVKNVTHLASEIEKSRCTHIVIDEIHFFEQEKDAFLDLILNMRKQGKEIILSGLDQSFRGEPFGELMPAILSYADKVKKLKANCSVCHQDRYCITQRIVNGKPADYNSELIIVGAEELYEPRCINCHECQKS